MLNELDKELEARGLHFVRYADDFIVTADKRKTLLEIKEMLTVFLKERGLTLAGAKQKLKDNKDTVIRQEDIVNRLKAIREELNKLKEAFDALQPGNE
jgi:retron-type reverse transcriptase